MRANSCGVCNGSDIIGLIPDIKGGTWCVSEVDLASVRVCFMREYPLQGFPSMRMQLIGLPLQHQVPYLVLQFHRLLLPRFLNSINPKIEYLIDKSIQYHAR